MGSKTRDSIPIGNSNARQRLRPTDAGAAAAPGGDLFWRSPVGKGQLRVLVVDDEPNAAESLSLMVKTWGHKACVAGNGAAALEMASAFQTDVVLLDIVMPKMDGCQVARRLRRQARFENTLLIALLGWADREQRPRAEEAGVDLCLIKPVEPSTLEVLLVLEQDWLAHASATPRKDTSRKPAKTRIHNRFAAADEETGCLA
jgi:CheY-like chemotaxis protein